ncbi:MAG: FlgD immunoglobulin-like domain containing protein, partial [bacterium]
TRILTVSPLVDEGLSAARQYEITFDHRLQARTYDIVLKAFQAADTTKTNYNVIAEFVFHVVANAKLTVNGRPTESGDLVPAEGKYAIELGLPVYVDPALFRVEADGETVTPIRVTNPDPADSTLWHVTFSQKFPPGKHNVTLFVEDTAFSFDVVVGAHAGLLNLIPYPNPFVDEVYFVFTNEIQITNGAIDIFTTSGKKVAHLNIPAGSLAPGQNAVRWDGRAFGGNEVANGVYLFVASVNQGGQESTQRGKLVRTR